MVVNLSALGNEKGRNCAVLLRDLMQIGAYFFFVDIKEEIKMGRNRSLWISE
jgi:hypothetical protein